MSMWIGIIIPSRRGSDAEVSRIVLCLYTSPHLLLKRCQVDQKNLVPEHISSRLLDSTQILYLDQIIESGKSLFVALLYPTQE
jgi:hypothetical protein